MPSLVGSQRLKLRRVASAAAAAPTDPSFASVVLNFINNNAANTTTTFLDQSPSPQTITANGDAQYSSAQAPTGMTTSGLFDGSGDFLTAPTDLAGTAFGTGDFTVEFMLRLGSLGAATVPVDFRDDGGGAIRGVFYITTLGSIVWYEGADRIVSANTTLLTLTWYHVALSRVSGNTKMFVGGAQVGSTYADSRSYVAGTLRIGRAYDATQSLTGNVSNVRITTGVGRYPTTFTPPALPFPTS